MSDPIKTIKYIVEALRNKPIASGVTRDPGQVPRRMAGSMFNPVAGEQQDNQYSRYRKIQSDAGESPVSYEEWLQK